MKRIVTLVVCAVVLGFAAPSFAFLDAEILVGTTLLVSLMRQELQKM